MIFVTGGTGLVGSHVLLKLTQQSREVKALKRESSCMSICRKIFSYYNADYLFEKIHWVDGSINDISSLADAMKGCRFVLHCAAIVSFSKSDIEILKKTNIEGTANVMNIALSSGIEKVGYVSSIATLGRNSIAGEINEESYLQPSIIDSNYAVSKYFAEQEVWRASAEGLDVVIVNPSIILGPGDWKKGSSQIFETINKGLKFYTTGSTGYVDVDDVAEALIQLLFSKIKNERFIVSAENLLYRDCFDRIAIALGKDRATIKVTPFLKEIAWRMEAVKSFFTGRRPLVTKETANSAIIKKSFSSAKIQRTIGFQFTEINTTIKKYSDWFIRDLV